MPSLVPKLPPFKAKPKASHSRSLTSIKSLRAKPTVAASRPLTAIKSLRAKSLASK